MPTLVQFPVQAGIQKKETIVELMANLDADNIGTRLQALKKLDRVNAKENKRGKAQNEEKLAAPDKGADGGGGASTPLSTKSKGELTYRSQNKDLSLISARSKLSQSLGNRT